MDEINTGLIEGKGYELSEIRDRANFLLKTLQPSHAERQFENRELRLLLLNDFQDEICFTAPQEAIKSVMFLLTINRPEDMAELIRSTDPISQCASFIHDELIEYDFLLNDRFCDANDLKESWENFRIPEKTLRFLGYLFNFNATKFYQLSYQIQFTEPILKLSTAFEIKR